MKNLTQITHKLVRNLGMEEIFVKLGALHAFYTKFIPQPEAYQDADPIVVKRNGVNFELVRRDYMQWHVYANLKEPLWALAWKYLDKRSVIFDIGSNIGAFSLKTAHFCKASETDVNIYAFEPNKDILLLLENNLNLNPKVSDAIQVSSFALSDKIGKLYFETGQTNSGSGKISSMPTPQQVEVTTIDEYVLSKRIENIGLIKIDVEGHEPLVVNGGRKTISKFRPNLIIEITDQWFNSIGSSAIEIFSFLDKLNYRYFSDISGKALPFNPNTSSELPFQFNILAIHESRV